MDQDTAVHAAGQPNRQREANQAMLEHIRTQEVEPYRDGQPVARVIDVVGRRSGTPRPDMPTALGAAERPNTPVAPQLARNRRIRLRRY